MATAWVGLMTKARIAAAATDAEEPNPALSIPAKRTAGIATAKNVKSSSRVFLSSSSY